MSEDEHLEQIAVVQQLAQLKRMWVRYALLGHEVEENLAEIWNRLRPIRIGGIVKIRSLCKRRQFLNAGILLLQLIKKHDPGDWPVFKQQLVDDLNKARERHNQIKYVNADERKRDARKIAKAGKLIDELTKKRPHAARTNEMKDVTPVGKLLDSPSVLD